MVSRFIAPYGMNLQGGGGGSNGHRQQQLHVQMMQSAGHVPNAMHAPPPNYPPPPVQNGGPPKQQQDYHGMSAQRMPLHHVASQQHPGTPVSQQAPPPQQSSQQQPKPPQPGVNMSLPISYRLHPSRNEPYMQANQAPSYSTALSGHHTQPAMRPMHQPQQQQQQQPQPQPDMSKQQHTNTYVNVMRTSSQPPQQNYRGGNQNANVNNNGRNGGRPQQGQPPVVGGGGVAGGQMPQQQQQNQAAQVVQQQQVVQTGGAPSQQAPHQNYIALQSYAQTHTTQHPFVTSQSAIPQAQYNLIQRVYPPAGTYMPSPFIPAYAVNRQQIMPGANLQMYAAQVPQHVPAQGMVNVPAPVIPVPTQPKTVRERSKRIPIINPDTGIELLVNKEDAETAPQASNNLEYDDRSEISSESTTPAYNVPPGHQSPSPVLHGAVSMDYRGPPPPIAMQQSDTPVVSAMADCPDKAPIQNINKKRKPVEMKAPPPIIPERSSPEQTVAPQSSQIIQDQPAANYVKQGSNEIPSNAANELINDVPKYEGLTDPIAVIESALSCDANPFEPKKYRETCYNEVITESAAPQENNNIMETVETTISTQDSFSSDKNENIVHVSSNLSPSTDETDKSLVTSATDDDTLIDSNIVNNNISVKEEPQESVEPEVEAEPVIEAAAIPVAEPPVTTPEQQPAAAAVIPATPVEPEPVAEAAVVAAAVESPVVVDENRNVSPERTEPVAAVVPDAIVPTKPLKSAASRSMEKSLITYEKNQWSPANTEGQRKYSMTQLRELCKSDLVKRPDLPADIASLVFSSGNKQQQRGGLHNKNQQFTMPAGLFPSFASAGDRGNFNVNPYSNKRSSQQGSRPSQQGGKSGSRSGVTQRHSFKQSQPDVKLNEAENAWKPRHLLDNDTRTPEQKETDELFKHFRSILNKVTPENFNVLLNQVMQLRINTTERLRGCISVVFEKAIAEPNYSRVYGELCNKMVAIRVDTSAEKKVTFKALLLTQCQEEFEKHKQDSSGQVDKNKAIEDETDEKKRSQMKELYEEEQYKIRHRAIGTVRFIGELYKIDMLNDKIMNQCVNLLLDNGDEDSLECLCKLLSTVGKTLEARKNSLNDCFARLNDIANGKSTIKVSSRIKFAIKDVIDLRKSKWQPRRNDQNPKTMGQIVREAEQEHRNIELLNSFTPNKRDNRDNRDDRRGGNMQGGGKYNNKDRKDGEWITAGGQKNSRAPASFDIRNLRTSVQDHGQQQKLGPSINFSDFITNSNRFQGLVDDNQSVDMSSSGPSDNYNKYESGGGYNSRTQRQNSRENSRNRHDMNGPSRSFTAPRQSSSMNAGGHGGYSQQSSHSQMMGRRSQQQPPAPQQQPAPQQHATLHAQPAFVQQQPRPAPAAESQQPAFSETDLPSDDELDKIIRKMDLAVSEYMSNQTFDDFIEFKQIKRQYRWVAIYETLGQCLDWKKPKRNALTELLLQTLNCRDATLLTPQEVKLAIKQYFGLYSDLELDCAKIHEFTAEIFGPLLHSQSLSFLSILECANENLIKDGHCAKLVLALIEFLADKYGQPRVIELWNTSKVEIKQFLADPTAADAFISKNKLNFLTGSTTVKLTKQDEILTHLKGMLGKGEKTNISTKEIKQWIDENVANVNSSEFIRALTTACIEFCITTKGLGVFKFHDTRLSELQDLFKVYIIPEHEVEALYAVQTLIKRLEFAQGLLQEICSTLCDNFYVSRDGFIAWRDDPSPKQSDAEGKGVCMKMLNSFFINLAEQSDESDDAEDND